MTASPHLPYPLRRGEIALVAFGAATAAALATSGFLLWSRGVSPGLAIVAALPPSLLLGFIGVASRYLCRALPLRTASRGSLAIAHAGSAAAASALWVATWKAWLRALAPYAGTRIEPEPGLLFGLGVLRSR